MGTSPCIISALKEVSSSSILWLGDWVGGDGDVGIPSRSIAALMLLNSRLTPGMVNGIACLIIHDKLISVRLA